MSYYSDVKICCEKKVYEELKEIIDKYDYNKPNKIQFVDGEYPYYIINWNNVQWYFNDAVEELQNKIIDFCFNNEEGYGIKQMIIGENIDDNIESYNDSGLELFSDYYIHRGFTVPIGNTTDIEI
jgi:hypothetical protein